MLDELHKVFIGMIAVLIVFTIMFSAADKIQKHNQAMLDDLAINQDKH